MSEAQTVETPVEKTYNYQPTDNEGRPIGGRQVIKYTTQDELVTKLQEQNVLLIRKLRDQTRKVRLGIEEREDLGDNLEHFSGPVEFKPRELSDEETYDIARRLQDPTTASAAAEELIEAKLGAPLNTIGSTLQRTQQDVIRMAARAEANAFTADNPGYYKCNENFEAITSWMVRYDLAPVKDNFQKAYDTLKAQGLLIEGAAPVVAPVVEQPTVQDNIVEQPVLQDNNAPKPPVVGIASGLTNDDSSNVGTPVPVGSDITYVLDGRTYTGLAAIAAMPSDEYKYRLLKEKGFAAKVDTLEADVKKNRQHRG